MRELIMAVLYGKIFILSLCSRETNMLLTLIYLPYRCGQALRAVTDTNTEKRADMA